MEFRNRLGDHPGGSEVIGRPSQRSGTGWETILEVRKWLETIPEVWNWSGDPPEDVELVGRHSRRSGSSRRPSRRSGTGWETLMEVRNRL